ncbi:CgeB family protein [Pseudoclavibacter terrae]|uniref:CgeB family protein n=1 Tax=Pseudoclavibacter terrae TaxID=1530195 RepID=UPI002330F56B|nr:glycosyltransferase [Pseudoclavibacter terrae]
MIEAEYPAPTSRQQRVLLISPAFHGYWKAISDALKFRGHEVHPHCYDAPNGLPGKVQNKLIHELPVALQWPALREAASVRAVRALDRVQPDVILVIKGDQLTDTWWSAAEKSGAARVLWLYDELERMSYSPERLRELGPVVSYSKRDVEALRLAGVQAAHVPDAHDSLLEFTPKPITGLSFIGARYSRREELLRAVAVEGIDVVAFGREWSRSLWDIARTRRFRGAGFPSGGDVPRAEYYGIMAGSSATLNMHGDGHDFSMRTFEAPGVGGLSLIDKPEVERYYDVGTETLVYSGAEDVVDIMRRAELDSVWSQSIRDAGRRKTLAKHTFVHRVAEIEQLWG